MRATLGKLFVDGESVNITNSYYANQLKQRGVKIKVQVRDNFFVPSEKDFDKLIPYLINCKTILDVGSGYGQLTTALSEKLPNTEFLGIDTIYWSKDFPIPKNRDNLKFEFNGVEAMAYSEKWGKKKRMFDCVLCCWMPMGSDWREELCSLAVKKVVLILSKDFCTGTEETYCGLEKFGFSLVGRAWGSGDSLIQLWEKNN